MATAYGPEAQLYAKQSIRLEDISLGTLGAAPEAIGALFALQNAGQKTAPYVVEGQGVVVLELKSKSEASEIGDYTQYENELLRQALFNLEQNLRRAITEKLEVKDERYKFF